MIVSILWRVFHADFEETASGSVGERTSSAMAPYSKHDYIVCFQWLLLLVSIVVVVLLVLVSQGEGVRGTHDHMHAGDNSLWVGKKADSSLLSCFRFLSCM